jgi:predicted Rossmann fold flavoprotein
MQVSYDVIVIGGGPAGLMACVGALRQHARVLLLEKGEKLGRKLIISGGGRCNVTNNKDIDEMVRQIPGNGRYMYTAFHQFGPKDIIKFFEGLGVKLKEEDNGRMFPVTDKATTVAETLIRHIRDQGVHIRTHATVERVLFEDGHVTGVLLQGGERIGAPAVVVASGGMSVPKTGSTGDGYPWARAAGHTITDLFPTEVPVTSNTKWIKDATLMGLSLRGVDLVLLDGKGKKLTTQHGDMLFTHFGVSGPAGLRLGHYVSVARRKKPGELLTLEVDMFPTKNVDEVYVETLKLVEAEPKKAIKNVLKGYVPERMVPLLLSLVELPEETTFSHLPKAKWQALARLMKHLPVTITGTLSIEEAFVTGGGVHTKEVDPKTMGSKFIPGLFFAGEVLDVHAHTGGYNITIAFSSGHVAGTSAAKWVKAAQVAALHGETVQGG